ncbi:energy transducer TonB [Variovorax sp. KBS0712]|uniref:energy transducer TonB n=1 Tax=Variovorax sp. KBS0712 TaxID=2578111 RepID=UPI0021B0FD81|nr:energy transducer TonB [Variovorax sp. KBS0712]
MTIARKTPATTAVVASLKEKAMSYRLRVGVLTTACALFSQAYAQEACSSFDGQIVQPVRANVLWKRLASIPNVKGEYETTEAYEARVANALGDLAGQVIVDVPIDSKFMVYDADANRLDVQSYAFSNGTTKYSGVFGYGTPFDGKIKYGMSGNKDVVYPSEEVRLGSYLGVTALGAKVRVSKIRRTTKAIFEREARWNEGLFANPKAAMSFDNITPATARQMKATAKAAIVYSPKAPYFAKGKFPWGEPTLEGPMDIDETIEVAIGTIHCALLLDSTGKVYAAAATTTTSTGRPLMIEAQQELLGLSGYAGRIAAAVRPNITFPEADSIQGNPAVELEALLSPDGTITSSRIAKSSGNDAWDTAALRGLQRTARLPRDVDGKVPSTLTLSLRPKR